MQERVQLNGDVEMTMPNMRSIHQSSYDIRIQSKYVAKLFIVEYSYVHRSVHDTNGIVPSGTPDMFANKTASITIAYESVDQSWVFIRYFYRMREYACEIKNQQMARRKVIELKWYRLFFSITIWQSNTPRSSSIWICSFRSIMCRRRYWYP